MKKQLRYLTLFSAALFSGALLADVVIPMNLVAEKGVGKAIGTVTAKDTPKGLLLTPLLHDLPPGQHGFHVHQFPSCANMGNAAGEHFDPAHTHKHLGPYKYGHEGDLPFLVVNQKGQADTAVLAPHLKEADIKGHTLMIHQGGDNYSDYPKKLGGGGPRIACGVIK